MLVGLALNGSTGWGEEGGALILGAPFGLQQMDGDFVLAGEQQTREVDVVLLRKETDFSALMTLTCLPGQLPCATSEIIKYTDLEEIKFLLRPLKHVSHYGETQTPYM